MTKRNKANFQENISLEAVLEKNYRPNANTYVSPSSLYSDRIWYFQDESEVRLNSVPKGRLQFDWEAYETGSKATEKKSHLSSLLPKAMLEELRVLAFLNLKLPAAFPRTGKQSVKPQTVVVTIRALVRLFSEIQEKYVLEMTPEGVANSPIQSIANISLADLRNAIKLSPRTDGALIKKGLTDLASHIMRNVFSGGALSWNQNDLNSLEFSYAEQRTNYEKYMPNELFRLLSNTACDDVTTFLKFLGLSICDTTTHTKLPTSITSIPSGSNAFRDYIEIRKKDWNAHAKSQKKQNTSGILRRNFEKTHMVKPEIFQDYLYRVQRAAYCVIGLYTGGRYSDLTTFKTNCAVLLHGQYVLVGTTVKNSDLGKSEDNDLWPAIPIMRDALQCLEEISKVTFNPYLFSGSYTVAVGATPMPLSNNGLTLAINNYLQLIDISKRWTTWHINPHQLRHTLARQLSRADVGLLYIAHQMKHLYTALSALPPDVTSQYGNIAGLTQMRAMESHSAHEEVAKVLYHPNQPIAGGGSEEFMARRKAYFSGMAAQGYTVDEVIANLAKQGLPFASVGLGYCGGRREILRKDGTKELPPCIGALECSPGTCKQAVITKVHEPLWKQILNHNNAMANDPQMSHAKDVFRAAASTAKRVLADLAKPTTAFEK